MPKLMSRSLFRRQEVHGTAHYGPAVLPPEVLASVAALVQEAEEGIRQRMTEGRGSQEPDLTSRLTDRIETTTNEIDGITIQLTVVDGIGPNSAERQIGADIVGVIRIDLDDIRVTKGFLAQAKRSGSQGVHYDHADESAGHWLYRGSLHLATSGTVSITRPSKDLAEQCENMLMRSPASFVIVYDDDQVSVVSASAVSTLRARPKNSKTRTPLGTKRLDDFFIHLADCFVGDQRLTAADASSIAALAAQQRATTGLLLIVSDGNSFVDQ
jgi:hypothetical protein